MDRKTIINYTGTKNIDSKSRATSSNVRKSYNVNKRENSIDLRITKFKNLFK